MYKIISYEYQKGITVKELKKDDEESKKILVMNPKILVTYTNGKTTRTVDTYDYWKRFLGDAKVTEARVRRVFTKLKDKEFAYLKKGDGLYPAMKVEILNLLNKKKRREDKKAEK